MTISSDANDDSGEDEEYNDASLARDRPCENSVKVLIALRLKDWKRVNASVSERGKAFKSLI